MVSIWLHLSFHQIWNFRSWTNYDLNSSGNQNLSLRSFDLGSKWQEMSVNQVKLTKVHIFKAARHIGNLEWRSRETLLKRITGVLNSNTPCQIWTVGEVLPSPGA